MKRIIIGALKTKVLSIKEAVGQRHNHFFVFIDSKGSKGILIPHGYRTQSELYYARIMDDTFKYGNGWTCPSGNTGTLLQWCEKFEEVYAVTSLKEVFEFAFEN